MLLAALSLVAALLSPRLSARAFREQVATAIADVDAVGAAAGSSLQIQRRWPSPAPPGEAPPELSAMLADGGGPFTRERYRLGWTTWEVVDSVEAPPEPDPPPAPGDPPRQTGPRMVPISRTMGAVIVRSSEEALLTELLRHYGSEASFLVDTTWVLVLAERAEESQGLFLSR